MRDSSASVVNLNDYRSTSIGDITYNYTAKARVESEPAPSFTNRETEIDDLYSADSTKTRNLARAISILSGAERRMDAAQCFMAEDDLLSADYEMTLVQSEIPELFVCADSDSGFAAMALAMHYAFQGNRGRALSEAQIFAIRHCVHAMLQNPFMSFEASLPYVDLLTDADLSVDPPEGIALGELLAD
jgi:hypothetical protein